MPDPTTPAPHHPGDRVLVEAVVEDTGDGDALVHYAQPWVVMDGGRAWVPAADVRPLAPATPAPDPESVAAAGTARWRAGRDVPEHLYRDEVPVATMPAHVVAEIVAAMGAQAETDARPELSLPPLARQLAFDAACDWSDYRADYGWPSHIAAVEAHRLFLAGWAAHRDGDTRGPLR